MAESRPRRGHGEDSMYFDHANNYWVAAVSLGYKAGKRVRRKVQGRTKTEVKAKLRDLRRDLDSGVRPNATYTVGAALDDWLANGLSGRSDRTKELRALRWNEVELDAGTVAVYRAVRATADTKTPKSRRVLSLPQLAVRALREHFDRQAGNRLLAGVLWEDHGLVFASAVGTPLDRHNVLREFRKITKAAGLGTDWVPREMRHTFVSLRSSNGTALADIADLVEHRGTAATETVYRKVIVPELRR